MGCDKTLDGAEFGRKSIKIPLILSGLFLSILSGLLFSHRLFRGENFIPYLFATHSKKSSNYGNPNNSRENPKRCLSPRIWNIGSHGHTT